MMNFLKATILKSAERAGYVIVKKAQYDALLSSVQMSATPVTAPPIEPRALSVSTTASNVVSAEPPVVPAAVSIPTTSSLTSAEALDFKAIPMPPSALSAIKPTTELLQAFEAVLPTIEQQTELSPAKALSIFATTHYLKNAGIEGDIIDCGEGSLDLLFVVACTLAALGDTTRRLVMFDVSGVPRNRSVDKLELWGADYQLINGANPRRLVTPDEVPEKLIASGYPRSNISILRYPRDAIEVNGGIAFLGLTAATYQSNRAAIGSLIPRLQNHGILAIEGNEKTIRSTIPGCVQHRLDAVTEYLKMRNIAVPFWHPADEFRLTILPQRNVKPN
jgi:hypothetical protein